MLNRPNKPDPDGLQSRVAALDDLLSIIPISDEALVAERNWKAAIEAEKDARLAYAKVSQESFYAENGVEYAELQRAHQARLDDATKEIARALKTLEARRAACVSARERIDASFVAATSKQITSAAPVLAEVLALCIDMLRPLEEIHIYACRKRLSAPRLFNEVPRFQDALQRMTAEVNRYAK